MNSKEKKIIAVGYVRVSTSSQVKSGESLPEQRKAIQTYSAAHSWKLQKIYGDEGVSGAKDDRPGLLEMLKDARDKKFQRVIFSKLDRFGRTARAILNNYDSLEKLGIGMISIKESIDTSTAMGRLFRTLLAAFAEFERSTILERTSEGRWAKVLKKETTNGKIPFGYRWSKERKKIEIDPGEQKTYLRLVDMILKEGMSLEEINRKFVREHLYHFTTTKLSYMLSNPAYYGDYVIKRFDHEIEILPDGKQKEIKIPRPENEWVHFDCPPLISKKDWSRMQEKIQSRKSIPRSSSHVEKEFLLWGMLKCGICGGRISSINNHGYRYYQCYWSKGDFRNIPPHQQKKCSLPLIKAERIERDVLDAFHELFAEPERVVRYWESITPPDPGETQEKLNRLGKEKGEIEKRKKRLIELYEVRGIEKIDLEKLLLEREERSREIKEEVSSLEEQRKAQEERSRDLELLKSSMMGIKKYAGQIQERFDSMSLEQKRQFLIHAFGGERLRVGTVSIGEMLKDDPEIREKMGKLTKADLATPIMGDDGKPMIVMDKVLEFNALMRGLEYMKFDFGGKPRLPTGSFCRKRGKVY